MNTKKFLIAVFFSVFAMFAMGAHVAHATSTDNVFGEVWSDDIGWISLNNCTSSSSCAGANFGVSMDAAGNLSGVGWSDAVGWVGFSPGSCPIPGCVTPRVNLATGAVSGWVEIADSTGWTGTWFPLNASDIGQSGWGWQVNTSTGAVTGQTWGDINFGWLVPDASTKIVSPLFPLSGAIGAPAPVLTISGTWGVTNPQGPGVTYDGAPYTVSWPAVANATSCTLDGTAVAVGGGSSSGAATGWAGNTHTFVLSCTGAAGTGTSSVTNISYPPAPASLSGSCNAAGNQVTLTWPTVSGYTTYYTRAQDSGGTVVLQNDTATGTSDTFSATPGMSYSAWVHTRDPGDGAWSAPTYSTTITCTSPVPTPVLSVIDGQFISNPQGPSVTNYGAALTASWPAVASATSCTLEGSPASVSGGSISATATGWAGNTHNFVLSCTGPGGSRSSTVTVSYPPQPSNLNTVCNVTSTQVTMTWTAPAGYNTFYTRAQDPSNNYVLYNDTLTGTTDTFPVTPGITYNAWVHTRQPGAGFTPFSNSINSLIACPILYNITASSGANGTVTPSGVTKVASGGSQNYAITPNAGYSANKLTVDGVSVAVINPYPFTNVTANHTISATFIPNSPVGVGPYTITASSGPNGTVTPAGATIVAKGDSQTYAITPSAGYTIATVTIDGTSVSVGSSHPFSNVQSNHTINATFGTTASVCGGSCGPLPPTAGSPTGIIYVEN